MIQRYLGNKSSIIEPIIEEVKALSEPGDYVCDIFAGTMSVSVNLKKHGYKVIANDISSFSYVFGNSYIQNSTIPEVNFTDLGIDSKPYADDAHQIIQELEENGNLHPNFSTGELRRRLQSFVILILYLESIDKKAILPEFRNSYFYDYYTEKGSNSEFVSARGSKGKRRFFIPENGERLDVFLNKIREWKRSELITETLYNLLISVILVSVEKISNTQGTFHDFIRKDYDSRALNRIKLLLPDFNLILSEDREHVIGKEMDSMEFIRTAPRHKILYIDPPYNFRQYTSYYFMLNLITDYCEIDDLRKYFQRTKYVRGQNMEKDFSSTFCKNSLFISSLKELIENAETEWIIMSYFNGRNHKSNSESKDSEILNEIEAFFKTELFEDGTLKIKNIERTNYQSYGGHSAGKVDELLYIVKKTNHELA